MGGQINEEILRIRQVMGLMSESFGIPQNIQVTSENVYEKIKEELRPYFNSSHFSKNSKYINGNLNIEFELPLKFDQPQVIGKSSFNEVNLDVRINVSTIGSQEPEFTSWGVLLSRNPEVVDLYRNKKKVDQITKVKRIKGDPNISMDISTGSAYTPEQMFDKLFNPQNKTHVVSVITHELKHWYDGNQIEFENTKELIRYVATQEANRDDTYKSLSEMFLLLYYCSDIENSVRVSELRAKYPELNKENFWSIIKQTELYGAMIKARRWNSKDFSNKLKSEIQMEYLKMSSRVSPQEFMENVQRELAKKIGRFLSIMETSYTKMDRSIPKSERKILSNYNLIKLLEYVEKYLNKSSDKILRIIGKIYSSLPD